MRPCQCGLTPLDGDTICPACVSDITKLLAETDGIVDELVRAVPRASLTASYGERVSASGSLHAPLPINEVALDAHMALDKWLMGRALELAKVTRVPLTGRDSKGLSSYLMAHINALRRMDWAGTVRGELTKLTHACELATRTAAQLQFAGTCQTVDCGAELFVRNGEDSARCRVCGVEYQEVQEWRSKAKAYARDTDHDIIGYPDAISQRLLRVHGEQITPEHIRLLASKGVLKRTNPMHGDSGKQLRAMYRLGDVKDLITDKEEAA